MILGTAEKYFEEEEKSLRIILPDDKSYKLNSPNWAGVLINGDGIRTAKGIFPPSYLEELQWYANFYFRSRRNINARNQLYPPPPEEFVFKDII